MVTFYNHKGEVNKRRESRHEIPNSSRRSFKLDTFRSKNKEIEIARKKRRGSIRYRNNRDIGSRCKKILDVRF